MQCPAGRLAPAAALRMSGGWRAGLPWMRTRCSAPLDAARLGIGALDGSGSRAGLPWMRA